MAKRKPWYEKHPFRAGAILMGVYLGVAVAMVLHGARGLDASTHGFLAFISGLGFLVSLPFVWTGVTRLANPKLKVKYTKYESSYGRTSSGERVHVSRPTGRATVTYSRRFALLSVFVGFAFYGGGAWAAISMGNDMRAKCQERPTSRCR